MDVKVRGVKTRIEVAPAGFILQFEVPNIKTDDDILKKLREWDFVKKERPNTGKPVASVIAPVSVPDVPVGVEVKKE